jgi:hypothetical protein
MKDWLAIIATLFTRIGTLGVFLVVFSFGAIFAEKHGAALPSFVKEWSTVGCLLGLALLATSIAVGATKLARGGVTLLIDSWAAKAQERQRIRQRAANAIANLEILDHQQAHFLIDLLRMNTKRLDVLVVSPARYLIQKDILVVKSQSSNGSEWICELHPAIADQRDKILAALEGRWTS